MKTHYDYIGVILITALVIGLVLTLAGCSSFAERAKLTSGCDLECKDCKEIKLRCPTVLNKDVEGEEQGNAALDIIK